MMFPMEVTWSDGESFWVNLWVTNFGRSVSVMATGNDTGRYAGVDVMLDDPIFSTRFTNLLESAVAEVADDGNRWQTQTWTAETRDVC